MSKKKTTDNYLEILLRDPVIKAYCRNLRKRGIKFEIIPMRPVRNEKHGDL